MQSAATQKFSKIEITSAEPISVNGIEYPSGSNLNEAFKVSNIVNGVSVSEAIRLQNADAYLFGQESQYILFQFVTKPDVSINQKFMISIEFSDGLEFELETEKFQID